MTIGIKGQYKPDHHNGDIWIGDVELHEWLAENFKKGANVSIHASELDPPRTVHIPEAERKR